MSTALEKTAVSAPRRRATIFVSLLMVLLATLCIVLLSNAADREVARLATSSQLREQSDLVLVHLIEMAAAERSYSIYNRSEDQQRFDKASEGFENALAYLNLIVHTQPQWQSWFNELKSDVEARSKALHARMAALGDRSHAPLIFPNSVPASIERLGKLLGALVHGDDKARRKHREEIALLRAALTIAAIIAVVSIFVLTYLMIQRFRRDIVKLKTYQMLLHSENAALEERVRERTYEVEKARQHAEKERRRVELLLQDASHRIGNSLATVSSLLGLQLQRSQNLEVRSALQAARDRIQTISTAHRRLRLSDDMETTLVDEFLQAVVDDVKSAFSAHLRARIHIETEFHPCQLSSRDATTLGIILGELLTNAIKHAFPNQRRGWVRLFFGPQDDGSLALIVEDNGVGITSKATEDIGSAATVGLGSLVVQQLCMQFGARVLFEKSTAGGAKVVIPLPKLNEGR
ncbi:sensor histidine kinase [Bartonella sp. DGB2]|uniref:sensor histidine kinase n=1 Tax=Bartonella sp. DGB2 TaxID=3388426 RepID=UPI00398F9659